MMAVWFVLMKYRSASQTQKDKGRGAASLFYQTAPLWILIGVYGAAAMISHLNIGHRHLAPIYPPLFILAGGAIGWLSAPSQRGKVIARRKRFDRGSVVLVFLGVAVLEGLAAFPHYLAYFSPLAGGSRQGYRHLVDSSLDWGMDLPGLKRWIDSEKHRSPQASFPIYLSYFGTGVPSHYGIDYKGLPSYLDIWEGRELFPLTGGIYCISATMLQTLYLRHIGPWNAMFEAKYQDVIRVMSSQGQSASTGEDGKEPIDWGAKSYEYDELRFARLCSWLRRREPDDRVGNSILIYRLSQEQVREAVARGPAELLPEPAVNLDYGPEIQGQ
jgi:hypothetical protein